VLASELADPEGDRVGVDGVRERVEMEAGIGLELRLLALGHGEPWSS
jgi:hypothetical protein